MTSTLSGAPGYPDFKSPCRYVILVQKHAFFGSKRNVALYVYFAGWKTETHPWLCSVDMFIEEGISWVHFCTDTAAAEAEAEAGTGNHVRFL